jgi:hypothetical protein
MFADARWDLGVGSTSNIKTPETAHHRSAMRLVGRCGEPYLRRIPEVLGDLETTVWVSVLP